MFTLHCRSKKAKNQSGFTLIELMVTIMVMAILATIATPSMKRQIAEAKVKNTTSLLANTFKQAKADAVIYRTNIIIDIDNTNHQIIIAQPINNINPSTCTTSSANSNTCRVQSYSFDENINISGTPKIIHFTPGKRIYENHSGTSPLPNNSGYLVCYNNISTNKNRVAIDTIGNVNIVSNGNCV